MEPRTDLADADAPGAVPAVTLYGREDELTRAVRAIRPPGGGGGLALLTGPAGIGKSALARQVLAAFPDDVPRGFGAPVQHIATPALWPWRQAARAIARLRPGGPIAGWLNTPDRGRAGGQASETTEAIDTTEATAAAALERLVDAFLAEAARGRIAVHLEDVQRFDELSLAVLELLAEPLSRVPLCVVACCRLDATTSAGVVDLLDAVAGRAGAVLVPLPPLADEPTHRLLDDLARHLDDAARRDVVRLGAGNPLLVIELARAHRNGRDTAAHPAAAGPTLGRLVEERVREVEAHGVLGALALLGRPAAPALLGGACGISAGEAQRVLRTALNANVVEPAEPAGTVRFAHALFADAAVASLDPATLRTLHHRLADRLPPAPPAQTPLSPAQSKVLEMAASGFTNDQIATRLGVSVSTVEKHLSQVYRRLGLPNRAASVRWYATRLER